MNFEVDITVMPVNKILVGFQFKIQTVHMPFNDNYMIIIIITHFFSFYTTPRPKYSKYNALIIILRRVCGINIDK